MIVDYMRIFPEHRTWDKLRSLPRSSMTWSLLSPGIMRPLSMVTYPLSSATSADNLSVMASVPPGWSPMFLCVLVIGGYLNLMSQVASYGTALEDNADLIAKDLTKGESSQWVYQKVGVKKRR